MREREGREGRETKAELMEEKRKKNHWRANIKGNFMKGTYVHKHTYTLRPDGRERPLPRKGQQHLTGSSSGVSKDVLMRIIADINRSLTVLFSLF